MAKLMLSELYDALRSVNVDDEKARAAASAVADHDRRLGQIETKLTTILTMLGIITMVLIGGFWAIWSQLLALSTRLVG